MIIAVAAIKGGVGKSAIVSNLAVYLQQQGHKVKVIEGDKQGTTKEWIEERRAAALYPDLRFAEYTTSCRDDLLADEKDGYTVLMDCGGHDSTSTRSALTAATHVLVPCRPKRRDIKTLFEMSGLIEEARIINPDLIARAVISQCPTLPSLGRRVDNAKAACRAVGIDPLHSLINNREVFDDADEDGSSVFEFKPADPKAIAEMTNVARELLGGAL